MKLIIKLIPSLIYRVVKMDWNSLANPAHHRFGPDWVKFFLQISIWDNF